jgi:hypothetical protein
VGYPVTSNVRQLTLNSLLGLLVRLRGTVGVSLSSEGLAIWRAGTVVLFGRAGGVLGTGAVVLFG